MTWRSAIELSVVLILTGCVYLLLSSLRILPGATVFLESHGEVVAATAVFAGTALALLVLQRFSRLASRLDEALGRERQLGLLSQIDPLTRILNRTAFIDELGRAIHRHRTGGSPFALLTIDLDRFRNVNHVHGHGVGDMVLVEVARRLGSFQTVGTSIARLGGDEFALLIENDRIDDLARRVARRLIESLAAPVWVPQGVLSIGATIGIATSELNDADAEELLRAANIALGEAKQGGRGTFFYFEESMGEALRRRSSLETDLRRAISAGEIVPFYQPLIALDDGRLTGFEVLARWDHPRYGLIQPSSFIPLAEELGRVGDLFYRILAAACADAKAWPKELSFSVNLSPTQFAEPQLAARILSILGSAGVDPSRLEIEITENALVDEVASAKLMLSSLREVGVGVALDDFGTGYSSLRHLNDLPIDRLKIDRLFLEGARQNIENWKIVRAIVQLAHSLDMETTAEGIEIPDVAEILRDVGCDIGQGFLFGKPLSSAATSAWLADISLGGSAYVPKLAN
ncbi:diguanylate cyclase (GGDEF) domain-containing protein [Kaistia soli DSM 19436]|uniref:Diguanylate cyclase (GGDEF) domain-containing protein n=1 Tax=Kaistia soli DSM 19436 TaxID=1122133 RepID=A0A1M5FTQ2_9HYPH|nr:EAL domain-containing protein [Kaistia soli]SHF94774.1 diguanylate cyclase (GGDEF) domain-containing protein [Kaistia soli DSM 19436]